MRILQMIDIYLSPSTSMILDRSIFSDDGGSDAMGRAEIVR